MENLNKNFYDIIIIGSGIAGLYSALKIKKYSPKTTFLVLEKNKKEWIGGRWGNENFHGSKVVTGAGVGRKKKDKLLMNLMKELGFPILTSTTEQYYAFCDPVDINQITEYLKKIYTNNINNTNNEKQITFEEFGKKYLPEKLYKKFLVTSGYTDYEKEDVKDVLYNYGMDDNQGKWVQVKVPWREMIEKLVSIIGTKKIQASSEVISISKLINTINKTCLFELTLKSGRKYYCNKVIVSTTIYSIRELVPGAKKPDSPYSQIHGQPFLRLYGKFSKASIPILKEYVKGYTVVEGPLQKIIPINPDKGIYMIAYSDNKNALYLKKYLENTEKNKNILCALLEKSLGIPKKTLQLLDIKDFYWPIGTHYYSPLTSFNSRKAFLKEVQNPEPGMLVVGEVVSDDQGWSEGALRSVEAVVTKKWIDS